MIILKKSLLFLCLLVLTSCFKQDTPQVDSDRTRTARDYEQLKACSGITFYEGFLYRKNLENLFVCTSWDKKFIKMFQALVETSDQSWNDLVAPIDAIFFGEKERRDRFIKYYQDLDSDGALDDLGRVITALTDTNFYDGLNALFECAENKDSPLCKSRAYSIEKYDIKNLLLIFDRDPSLLLELSNIIDGFHSALGKDSEKLRREIIKFNSTSFFNKLRVLLVSEFATKYTEGLSSGDLKLIRGLFLAKQPVSDRNWLSAWVSREDVTSKYVNKLVSMPVNEQPQIIRDIKVLNQLYNGEVVCSDENLELKIDIKSLVSNTIVHLKDDDIVKFFDSLLMAAESVNYARPICPELTDANRVISYYEYTQQRNVNHTVDLANVLKYSVELLAKMPTIDFLKFGLELINYDNDYIMELLASDLLNVSNEVNRVVVENSDEFYSTTLSIMKRADEDMYYSMAYLLNDLFSKPKSEDLASWMKAWLFWNEKEQNFLFNFIDVHLDSDTNYVRLFSFYSLFLKEVSNDWKMFGEYYNKNEETKERTFQALKEVVSKLNGKEILADYKRFFSRDHILELLKVITSNGGDQNNSINKLLVKNLDQQRPYESPEIRLVSKEGFDNEKVVACVKHLSEHKSLYSLLNKYPSSCSEVNNSYFLDDLSSGLSKSMNEFQDIFPSITTDHFFKKGGILSPEMTLWALSSVLSLNNELKNNEFDLDYLFGTLDKYFFKIGEQADRGISIFKNTLDLALIWFGNESEVDFRNGAVSELVKNKSRIESLFKLAPVYIKEFEEWNKTYVSPKYVENPKYSCENYINTHVGGSVCPSEKLVKKNINLIAKQMVTRHEDSEGIPIEYILRAALPDGGVLIPLDGKETKNKRLTLLETFNYLYDLSDKSLKINREKVKYKNRVGGDKEYYTMTTSERIDHVIRNVSFRDNYLGVQYLNAVVKGKDYTDVVKEKQRLMGICLNTPGIRCGKSMTKEDRWKGKNAFWAYDGLVDVNNGNDLEARFNYGEFMQAFMFNFVASSSLDAQEVKLFPLDDDVLKKHNGKALGYISDMAGFSNMGRVVHDRVGRTREEFLAFINSPQFMRVNKMILSRISERDIIQVAEELFTTIESGNQDALSDLISWINTLSYSELRMTEEIIAKSIYVSTFLGSEKQVFGNGDEVNFRNNSSFEILYIINQLMTEFKTLKGDFIGTYSLNNALSPMLNTISFIYEKLSHPEEEQKYWFILNSSYSFFRELMYVRDGITSFIDNVIKKKQSTSLYNLISSGYNYLIEVEKTGTRDIQNVLSLTYESSVGMDSFWDFVENTSVRSICSLENEYCEVNDNYDDLVRISYVLNRKDNLEKTLTWLLVDSKKTIINTANDFFPYLKIVK